LSEFEKSPNKLVCPLLAVILGACGTLYGQTFEVGGQGSNAPAAKTQKNTRRAQSPQSSESGMGWGSSIEVAREAHAAREALQRNDYRSATSYASRAAQAAPQNPDLWFLYAYASRMAGDYSASVDAYKRGLQERPSSIEGLSGLAQTYAKMGRNKEAEDTLKAVIAANPKGDADLRLAGELTLSSDPKLALTYLERAEAIHPSARNELLMARAYERAGDKTRAKEMLDRARKTAPRDPDVARSVASYYRESGQYDLAIETLQSVPAESPSYLSELGYTYELAGKKSDAAEAFVRAANKAPERVDLQLSAAQALVNAKHGDRAETLLKRVEGADPNQYRLHAIRGQINHSRHQDQDAIREYELAVRATPPSVPEGVLYPIALRLDLAQLYRDAGNAEKSASVASEARAQLEKLDVGGPDRAEFLRLKAASEVDEGDYKQAEADLKEALQLQPANVNLLLNQGNLYRKTQRADEASKAYQQVLSIDPTNASALESLGYLARATGDAEASRKYFEKLAQIDPNDFVAYLAMGDLFAEMRKFPQAQANYEKAHRLVPDNPLIVARGMNAALEGHDTARAKQWFEKATEAGRANPEVMREQERYLTITGNYQESAKLGYAVIEKLPRDPEAPVYLAYDLLFMNRYADAMAIVQRFEPSLPKDKDLPLIAGYVYAHDHDYAQAVNAFTRALERDPEMSTGYMNRGYVLNDMRLASKAEQDFRKALSLRPDYGEAHLGLAYSLLQLRRPQAALKETDAAEKTLGESGSLHLARAEAYRQRSMLARAEGEYQRAIKLQPNEEGIYLALADTQFRLRQYQASADTLNQALTLFPDSSMVNAQLAESYAELGRNSDATAAITRAERTGGSDYRTLLTTASALMNMGERDHAMERYARALDLSSADRLHVRLALARFFAQEHKSADAQQQVALAFAEARVAQPDVVTPEDYLDAADILLSIDEFILAQRLFARAQALGADDLAVSTGMANASLALGETSNAEAVLHSVQESDTSEQQQSYGYLVALGNVYRQQGDNYRALTAFARANELESEDPAARNAEFELAEEEGRQVTENVGIGSHFQVAPIFEDENIYQLDARLRGFQNGGLLLPPPRHSVETFADARYTLHVGSFPVISGFVGERNAYGTISIPSQILIEKRNTLDTIFNFGVNPTVRLGSLRFTITPGIQFTLRRDTLDPFDMNQNLFRQFLYVSSSPILNWVSFSGNVIREAGPFTEQDLHSRDFSGTIDFRVGRPWSKTVFLTGYNGRDLLFGPTVHEYFTTTTYAGLERRFGQNLTVSAVGEYLRAWRVEGTQFAIAQTLRPRFGVDAKLNEHWSVSASGAWSRGESFHAYDTVDAGVLVSYLRETRAMRRDGVATTSVSYPMRFSFGVQQQTFYDFPGHSHVSIVPVVKFTLF
jgi:tetratricopeptide (TPR) repeat protein